MSVSVRVNLVCLVDIFLEIGRGVYKGVFFRMAVTQYKEFDPHFQNYHSYHINIVQSKKPITE